MKIKIKGKVDGPWFAWYPVWTKNNELVWLETVHREWNDYLEFCIITCDDPGDYVGGWEYTLIGD